MNIFQDVKLFVQQEMAVLLPNLPLDKITVEAPKDAAHGDMATNAAMVMAKPAGQNPRALAEQLAARLKSHPQVTDVTVAGPGFINLQLSPSFWQGQVKTILQSGARYGAADVGQGQPFNVEYVSANPTGPLLASHARGAVFGDALCNLLEFVGYKVCREYYLNDYGNQVNVLARSVYLRYREALGETVTIPDGCYPGEYLIPVGQALAAREGDTWLNAAEDEWLPLVRAFAIDEMMKIIKADLELLGIVQDVVLSERHLVESGAVQAAFDKLQADGHIYFGQLEAPKGEKPEDWEPRDQYLFRATDFGDDVDRPLKKSDGSWTYFASDVACHFDKFQRGFKLMANVFGADHAGYVKRIIAATRAVSGQQAALDIKTVQLVRLLENGQLVKLSKRAGNLVFLSDVVERVGKDVVRLIMLTRRQDQTLDFDFAKVTEQSKDNPVFYIQYAHARICSVLRHAAEQLPQLKIADTDLTAADLSVLVAPEELSLIKLLAGWPRLVETAADLHEPHRFSFYLMEAAAAFHQLWTGVRDDATLRFLQPENPGLTAARLALLRATALVIAAGLNIIGVAPVEQM